MRAATEAAGDRFILYRSMTFCTCGLYEPEFLDAYNAL
jgi:hypothetical protein